MKSKLLVLGLVVFGLSGCNPDVLDVAELSAPQRKSLNAGFNRVMSGLIASGTFLIPDEGHDTVRREDIQIEYSGVLSLAASPTILVPTLTVSRQITLPSFRSTHWNSFS